MTERSPARDAALDAITSNFSSVSRTLFPGGVPDAVEAFIDLADRRMEQDCAAMDLSGLRTPARVRTVIAVRLRRMRPQRAAIRRAAGLLALPGHARLAARCTARTTDAIWRAAGDRSADFSWYSKRALLAVAYTATLLFWLNRDDPDEIHTLAFLDRRLAEIGQIGRVRRLLEAAISRLSPRPTESVAA